MMEFDWTQEGELRELVPGVFGVQYERSPQETYLYWVTTLHMGQGLGGKFLDHLDRGTTWKIPVVMNQRFKGMLERRGWVPTAEYSPLDGDWTEVYVLPRRGEEVPMQDPERLRIVQERTEAFRVAVWPMIEAYMADPDGDLEATGTPGNPWGRFLRSTAPLEPPPQTDPRESLAAHVTQLPSVQGTLEGEYDGPLKVLRSRRIETRYEPEEELVSLDFEQFQIVLRWEQFVELMTYLNTTWGALLEARQEHRDLAP
jgi:hypothetical protein